MVAVPASEVREPAGRDRMEHVAVESPLEETDAQVPDEEAEHQRRPPRRELAAPDRGKQEPERDEQERVLHQHLDAEPQDRETLLTNRHRLGLSTFRDRRCGRAVTRTVRSAAPGHRHRPSIQGRRPWVDRSQGDCAAWKAARQADPEPRERRSRNPAPPCAGRRGLPARCRSCRVGPTAGWTRCTRSISRSACSASAANTSS